MMNVCNRCRLFVGFYLIVALLLAGCAGQKSLVVLLPEDGKVSGEVTVENAHGSQVLNQSWQAAEIPGADARPATPVMMGEMAVQGIFGEVLSAMPLPAVRYILYFSLDSAELMPESQLLLPEVLKAVNARKPAELSVVGHTDTTGSVEYNYRLGLLRARTVPELLMSLGAAPAIIETLSRGKSDLLVKTGDQTPEPRNRRAEVTIR
jgi:outer membrane protein OmpA-like peptidoglycan-associated protein